MKIKKKLLKNYQKMFSIKISKRIKDMDAKISFEASNRLSCTAWRCEYKLKKDYYGNEHWKFKIIISSKIINNLFSNNEKTLKINGIKCFNKLECYVNLYEHELIHLLIYIFCIEKGRDYGGHTPTFKNIAYNLFRHTDYKHNLLCGDSEKNEKDMEKFKKEVEIGDTIISKVIKGKIYEGIVFKLTSKYVYFKQNDGKNLEYFIHGLIKF